MEKKRSPGDIKAVEDKMYTLRGRRSDEEGDGDASHISRKEAAP